LEDDDIILMEEVVALVRSGGRTIITLRGNSVRESGFTPATLGRRMRRSRDTRGAGTIKIPNGRNH
jgi:hypothetical protein